MRIRGGVAVLLLVFRVLGHWHLFRFLFFDRLLLIEHLSDLVLFGLPLLTLFRVLTLVVLATFLMMVLSTLTAVLSSLLIFVCLLLLLIRLGHIISNRELFEDQVFVFTFLGLLNNFEQSRDHAISVE